MSKLAKENDIRWKAIQNVQMSNSMDIDLPRFYNKEQTISNRRI